MPDANAYTFTFPAFIALCGILAWFFVKRQIDRADKDAEAAAKSVDNRFADQGRRIGENSAMVQDTRLQLANKVGREEIDKVYDKLDAIKKEWKDDMHELKNDLLIAIRGK